MENKIKTNYIVAFLLSAILISIGLLIYKVHEQKEFFYIMEYRIIDIEEAIKNNSLDREIQYYLNTCKG